MRQNYAFAVESRVSAAVQGVLTGVADLHASWINVFSFIVGDSLIARTNARYIDRIQHTIRSSLRAMEEILFEGKHFKLVNESELPEIVDILATYLPDSIKFHQTIKTYLNDRIWNFHFYVTKTWPENPVILHFPGMTLTPNGNLYESFSVFCPCDKLDSLKFLEQEDVLINWNQPLYLNFTHNLIIEKIEDFYQDIGTIEKQYGDFYILSNSKLQDAEDEELAENAKIIQLREEHMCMIHDLYPANQMEGIEVFKKLVKKLPCYGVFSSDGELAAWMVQSYYGAMFSMQTKSEYRRKGYGFILAKYLTKIVRERGYIPFVVIRPENDASKGLYFKLGFKKHFQTIRAILRPYDLEITREQEG
ncbi:unnamed protein product [Brassicogethes aeneus]|uniref:N-acetyltransferase domain-containing protein n=1 Tax=Brassicogethes aeneus TaxID=1431903 RepID=A0A9P0B143_BRAAE|nr:unnamed protein product [Brassicogethes aeneus]